MIRLSGLLVVITLLLLLIGPKDWGPAMGTACVFFLTLAGWGFVNLLPLSIWNEDKQPGLSPADNIEKNYSLILFLVSTFCVVSFVGYVAPMDTGIISSLSKSAFLVLLISTVTVRFVSTFYRSARYKQKRIHDENEVHKKRIHEENTEKAKEYEKECQKWASIPEIMEYKTIHKLGKRKICCHHCGSYAVYNRGFTPDLVTYDGAYNSRRQHREEDWRRVHFCRDCNTELYRSQRTV